MRPFRALITFDEPIRRGSTSGQMYEEDRLQHRAEFAEAECWVFTTDWDWPFSFVNLCELFGFDPEAVRRALRAWKRAGRDAALRRQRFRPVTLHAA